MKYGAPILRPLSVLARRLWPDLDQLPSPDRQQLMMELFSVLIGLPWVVVSLAWLITLTDWDLMASRWGALVLLLVLSYLLSQITFFQVIPGPAGRYSYNSSNLSGIVLLAAVFIFGPTGVWLMVVGFVFYYAGFWPNLNARLPRWTWIRNMLYNLGLGGVLSVLLMSAIYQRLGGVFPLEGLNQQATGSAFLAFFIALPVNALYFLIWGAALTAFQLRPEAYGREFRRLGGRTFLFMLLSDAPGVFGILLALLYVRLGVGAFLFAVVGVVLVGLLARSLSRTLVASQARSQELAQLEQLGRAIIAGPPDAAGLPDLLAEYVPRMLIFRQIEIRLFGEEPLLQFPPDLPPVDHNLWDWLIGSNEPAVFAPGEPLPWRTASRPHQIYITQIRDAQTSRVLGGICLVMEVETFVRIPADQMPALQVLSDQIASALHGARVYAQTLEHQKVAQELAFAGQIQASFLPEELPEVEGWDLAARLLPARETSGDFYDLIPLEDGLLGIVVGDVTDKGVGAALFMALSRTLIRTYAIEYPRAPAQALQEANRRILLDAQAGLFVTLFYGVLDPVGGLLSYANAGHNPPFLLDKGSDREVQRLIRTGVPLGMFEDEVWTQAEVRIPPGGLLVLYSDGLTEAHDGQGELFGEGRLQELLCGAEGRAAVEVAGEVLESVQAFTGAGIPSDDLTLLVLRREIASGEAGRGSG